MSAIPLVEERQPPVSGGWSALEEDVRDEVGSFESWIENLQPLETNLVPDGLACGFGLASESATTSYQHVPAFGEAVLRGPDPDAGPRPGPPGPLPTGNLPFEPKFEAQLGGDGGQQQQQGGGGAGGGQPPFPYGLQGMLPFGQPPAMPVPPQPPPNAFGQPPSQQQQQQQYAQHAAAAAQQQQQQQFAAQAAAQAAAAAGYGGMGGPQGLNSQFAMPSLSQQQAAAEQQFHLQQAAAEQQFHLQQQAAAEQFHLQQHYAFQQQQAVQAAMAAAAAQGGNPYAAAAAAYAQQVPYPGWPPAPYQFPPYYGGGGPYSMPGPYGQQLPGPMPAPSGLPGSGAQHLPDGGACDTGGAQQQQQGGGGGGGGFGGPLDVEAAALKRPRLIWTEVLHRRFVDALDKCGGVDKALPKAIMKEMDVKGLTRENVASHLQKHRLRLRKEGDEDGAAAKARDKAATQGGAADKEGQEAEEEADCSSAQPAQRQAQRAAVGEGRRRDSGGAEAQPPPKKGRQHASGGAAAGAQAATSTVGSPDGEQPLRAAEGGPQGRRAAALPSRPAQLKEEEEVSSQGG